MTKKNFVALADRIKMFNRFETEPFTQKQIEELASFCASQSSGEGFKKERWLQYIAGQCGKNGGKVEHNKVLHGRCKICGHFGDDCTGK